MQRQNSGQKTPMALNKFSTDRKRANTPTSISKTQRSTQVAAVVAVCERVLSKAAGTKPKPKANGDIRKFDFTSGPGSLGDILRRALIAKGRP